MKRKGLREALRQEMEKYPPAVRADLVRLRLIQNLHDGEDRAVQSAKLLGQDRELNLWEPESESGKIVIVASLLQLPTMSPDKGSETGSPQDEDKSDSAQQLGDGQSETTR